MEIMGKRVKDFQKIEEYKTRFKDDSLEKLRKKLNAGFLYKEAAVAIKELIEEKEQDERDQNREQLPKP